VNFFLVSYDLITPGQKYDALIAEIKSSPTSGWAKLMLSCFIVKTSEDFAQLASRLHAHLDANDRLVVIRVCRDYKGWLSPTVHKWMSDNLPPC
jgi:hypothetical protein